MKFRRHFFIRRELWEEMRGFDPNLQDYGNESELCMQILERGWRIVWARASYIHHFGRQTFGRLPEKILQANWQAAREYIARKHAHG